MKKTTWKAAFTAALFGTCAITTSAHSNLWMNSSNMVSHHSSETSTAASSKRGFARSKDVHVQTYQDGDAVVKKTIETTTENGVKTTKTTEEYTKDGHTEVATQTTTEKVKGRKCCGLKKIKKLKQWLNNLEHQAHHQGARGGDCDEKCKQLDAGQGDMTVHTNAGPDEHTNASPDEHANAGPDKHEHAVREQRARGESKKMVQKALRLDKLCDAIAQMVDRAIDGAAVVHQKIALNQDAAQKE
jgi:hypothetical protein